MKTTYLIVTKNNEKTLDKTLKSLQGNILAIDLGSEDQTIDILKSMGVRYTIDTINKQEARNLLTDLADTDHVFHIEPWEILIEPPNSGENGLVKIFQNSLICKEIRFWNKKQIDLKFKNPLYPQISNHILSDSGAIICSQGNKIPLDEGLDIINKWEKTNPKNKSIPYYKAFLYLENRKYKEFINSAEEYLFLVDTGLEVVNLKYYLSTVYLYVYKNPKKAMEKIMECIVVSPEMSEYWCLAGDIFYYLQKYKKAQSFYENAIISGSLRKDGFNPIEIEKYKEYPNEMIEKCKNFIK